MIVRSGSTIQKRKVRKDGWTVAKRAEFLDVLAATCNISAACAAVGKTRESARTLKRRDGEFARLWADAFEAGTERLHEELYACALGQVASGDNPDAERGDPDVLPRFNPDLAIQILKLQHGTHPNRKKVGAPAQADVDIALTERLEALAKKLAAQ